MLTVGVEEEFLLLDRTGAVASAASKVARHAGFDGRITPEYMSYQLETMSRVCRGLDELRSDLVALRRRAAAGARQAGVWLIASGTPPFRAGPLDALSDHARYRALARQFPSATAAGGTCACHVHVGVPDRDLAVAATVRLRPWLPALLALTVNSPYTADTDTGWASYRYVAQRRWPTFRAPEFWPNARRYDEVVHSLVTCRAALDEASVYFLARPSARYPTVEVRVADTCLTSEDAVMYAGLVRALVATVIEDERQRRPQHPAPRISVDAALLMAAQRGTRTTSPRPPQASAGLVARLLSKVTPALAAAGDLHEVRAWVFRQLREGTGADRQRSLWSRAECPAAFVIALAGTTVPSALSV
ncbi:carboxylate-amine ligase [Couchioplanes caeruleus]|uniref:Putative glutamate--cysteine ligase 2 n=2 Tax=Couchioplanes caeruleus TaxID=56438 RepID=A0A1K0FTL8_9ACTN|nr:YbdK family carboxylate-amine ligase [Couchioplanes caeruleus]OJF16207.1 carboxylate-amine ligase [Couchioplanes caeruleus subsp. caeruleus]ROP28756.1 carboxylate-amine ligase [Couchioplanes caeruleus]